MAELFIGTAIITCSVLLIPEAIKKVKNKIKKIRRKNKKKKLLKKLFIKEIKNEINNDICVICQDNLKKQKCSKLYCNHQYHSECIIKWIMIKPKCPLCNDYLMYNNN